MITVPQAARRTGRDPETIRRWIRAGRLRSTKVGTQHMIDEGDLDAGAAPAGGAGPPQRRRGGGAPGGRGRPPKAREALRPRPPSPGRRRRARAPPPRALMFVLDASV